MDSKENQDTGQTIDVKVTPVEPVEAPAEEKTTPDVTSESNASETQENASESNPVATADQQASVASPSADTPAPSQQSPKSTTPIVAIIAAIFVALLLAAITVYAYMQQQASTEKPTDTTQKNTPAVDEADFNDTEKELDNALQSIEASEFDESELSDESLGL